MSDAAPDTAATTGAGGGAGATDAPAAEPAPAPAPAAASDEPTDDGDDDGKTSDGKAPEKPVTINGVEYPPLADGEYDAIVLGTGLKETILAGALAMKKMRVLQLDRNSFYGGDTASLNLTNLWEQFRDTKDKDLEAKFMEALGSNRLWNVDLVPKFIMADGKLVQLLVQTGVADYLTFRQVEASFVWKKGSGVHKMPATATEALKTSLMGFFQKRKFKNFLNYVIDYDQENPKTWKGMDLTKVPMKKLYSYWDLDANSQDFAGHGMALHSDDSYLDKPAMETVKALKLYGYSLNKHGSTSPFIYPLWGLGGLPEGFTRKAAINNATYMLNTKVDEILFDKDGVAKGIRVGKAAASCSFIIGAPSYFPKEKVRRTGQVVRSICILKHYIAGLDKLKAGQIIIPQRQAGRSHDIYLSVLSHYHEVCPASAYLAIASTTVETKSPLSELKVAFDIIGDVFERFDSVKDTYEPVGDGTTDRCFITTSYDATSHFESTIDDIITIYERVTGEPLIASADDAKESSGGAGAGGGAGVSGKK